jgi:hypothetical protein
MKRLAFAVSLASFALLAGCGDQKKDKTAGTAGGEILPGSTSDAMLPLDTVRSQPPLAPRVEGSGKADDKASDEPAGDATEQAPAETPAPAAETSAQ